MQTDLEINTSLGNMRALVHTCPVAQNENDLMECCIK